MKKEKANSYTISITAIVVLVLVFGITITQGASSEKEKSDRKVNDLEIRLADLESKIDNLSKSNREKKGQIKALQTSVKALKKSLANQEDGIDSTSLQSVLSSQTNTVSKETSKVKTKTTPKKTVSYSYLEIAGLASYNIEYSRSMNALDQLQVASEKYDFSIQVTNYDFGTFVDCIGGVCGDSSHFWSLYKNGEASMVGASDLTISINDKISWVYTSF